MTLVVIEGCGLQIQTLTRNSPGYIEPSHAKVSKGTRVLNPCDLLGGRRRGVSVSCASRHLECLGPPLGPILQMVEHVLQLRFCLPGASRSKMRGTAKQVYSGLLTFMGG